MGGVPSLFAKYEPTNEQLLAEAKRICGTHKHIDSEYCLTCKQCRPKSPPKTKRSKSQ